MSRKSTQFIRQCATAGIALIACMTALPAQAQLTVVLGPSGVTFAPDNAEFLNTCCGVAAGPASCAPAWFPIGDEYWWTCGVFLDSTVPCGSHFPAVGVCGSTSVEDGLVRVRGNGTDTMSIQALNLAYDDYDCCCCPGGPYYSISWQSLLATLYVQVNAPAPCPPGAPVTVNFRWDVRGAAWDEGPIMFGGGNLAASSGAASIGGTSLFGNEYDVWDDRGARTASGTGTISTSNGATLLIVIGQYVDAYCLPPASPNPCVPPPPPECTPEHDTASSRRETNIILTVACDSGGGGDPPPDPCPTPTLEFSTDIGSDTEWSDPLLDGNEVFEPFDMYLAGGPALPPLGADGVRTDEMARGADFSPFVPGGPGAPTCTGGPVISTTQLDLDGTDSIDFDLSAILPGAPPATPIPRFPSTCVQELNSLLISFDDDTATHWVDASCSVPVGSTSPAGATYGSTPSRDELFGVALFPNGATYIAQLAPVASESGVHISLSPDPPPDLPGIPTPQDRDDDVDALDLTAAGCGTWLFGIDHEARGTFPPSPNQAGIIYQWTPGGGAVVTPVISPSHLGLPLGVDIRDFELVWMQSPPGSGAFYLALVFAIAPDDPVTPATDESGGLDSRMIYASFLTGSSFALLSEPLPDSVDAIANWCEPYVPMSPPATALCATCPGDVNGDVRIDGVDVAGFVDCMINNRQLRYCRCAAVNGTAPLTASDVATFVNRLLTATSCP